VLLDERRTTGFKVLKLFFFSNDASDKKARAFIRLICLILLSGNDIEQNCKYLQIDACIRALIKTNEGKVKQLRLTY
jgi:hypothetical protein